MGALAAAAVAAADVLHAVGLAVLAEDFHLAADDAGRAGDLYRQGRLLDSIGWIAQEQGRFLALVGEDHVEHAVVVDVHQAHGLRVEDALIQADRLAGVLEGAVAAVLEEVVGAAQAADHDIDVAVVVEIAPGGAGGLGKRPGQVAGFGGDVVGPSRDILEIALTKLLGKASSRVGGTGHVQLWANLTVDL